MKRTNEYYQPQREAELANKIRLALNESLEQLPSDTTDRLALARKFAVSRKKNRSAFFVPAVLPAFVSKLAGGFGASSPMNSGNSGFSWFTRMGVVLPILVLIIGLVGMYEYEEQKRVSEMAEIDELVLSDELPLSAYLDHGFSAYLNTQEE